MPNNLKEKIALILKDTERMGAEERLNRLIYLIDTEIDSLKAEHQLSFRDLTYIRSRSIGIYNAINLGQFSVEGQGHRSEPENARTFAMVAATVEFLKTNGLSNLNITVKK